MHKLFRSVSLASSLRYRGDSLSKSVVMFITQSILKTTFELKVLHASGSRDQLTETLRPHQNVSRKQVVIIDASVNPETR